MIVTGQTNSSRLSELRKFIATDDITKQYFEYTITYRAYGSGGDELRTYDGENLRVMTIENGVDFSSLVYSDEEPEYRAWSEENDELRTYDGENLRAVTSPLLLQITYYIDGIKYTDYVQEGYTVFEYYATGVNEINFTNVPYYKDPKKENIISLPKIDNDVFIIRQQLSAFENNYLLEHINNLSELQTFAAGNYFNIVNNT